MMRLVDDDPGGLLLMSDDAPARAVASRPGWGIVSGANPVLEMGSEPDDPFDAAGVLSDDPSSRYGSVLWEIAITHGDRVIAIAAISKSLGGPQNAFYTISLDKVFVDPDFRMNGTGSAVVDLVADVFESRTERFPNIDRSRSHMSCEPASDGGEALADRMNAAWRAMTGRQEGMQP